MATIYTKKDNYTLVAIREAEIIEVSNEYDYGFLKKQREIIVNELNKRQAEIDEIDKLIAEANKLGIVEKPIAVEDNPKMS